MDNQPCDDATVVSISRVRTLNNLAVPEIKSRKSFSLYYKNALWPIMTPIDHPFTSLQTPRGVYLPTHHRQ